MFVAIRPVLMPCQAERKLTFWAEICLDNSFCCHVSVCWRLALRGFCCTLSCDGHHETQRAHADIIDHDNAASHRVMVASLASHCVQTLQSWLYLRRVKTGWQHGQHADLFPRAVADLQTRDGHRCRYAVSTGAVCGPHCLSPRRKGVISSASRQQNHVCM